MGSKLNNINYNSIAARFISDKKLSLIIIQNISFAEKYLDVVEEMFFDDVEKAIVYRELGSIVYSCIETLLKSILCEINNRCEKSECKDTTCKYRRIFDNDETNKLSTINALKFLMTTRLIGLSSLQFDEFKKLNDLRNYIHLSKNIVHPTSNSLFDKKYVERLLFYYYEILDQFDLGDFYFNYNDSCLKVLDQDEFEITKKQLKNDMKVYYMIELFDAANMLLLNKELTEDYVWILKSIDKEKDIHKNVIEEICKEVNYSKRRYKDEESFEKAKQAFLSKLRNHFKNKSLLKRIVDGVSEISF